MNTLESKFTSVDVITSKANTNDVSSIRRNLPWSKSDFCPTSIERFVSACRANAAEITDQEIVDDIRSVRYARA